MLGTFEKPLCVSTLRRVGEDPPYQKRTCFAEFWLLQGPSVPQEAREHLRRLVSANLDALERYC